MSAVHHKPINHCAECGVRIDPRAHRCNPCRAAHERHARRAAPRAYPVVMGYCRSCASGGLVLTSDLAICAACKAAGERRHYCPLDGLALDGHPACPNCEALTGSAHMQRATNQAACSACVDWMARRGRVQWAS